LEYWNGGLLEKVEYRLLEGHAPAWPDATERVPPINPLNPVKKYSCVLERINASLMTSPCFYISVSFYVAQRPQNFCANFL